MRNPFARLARPAAVRPSLRDRAAALKASASSVIRRDTDDATPATSADPIFAAIEEIQRLTDARTAAGKLPLPLGSIDPLPEQDAAMKAQFAHIDGGLLKTVPTTAAGCASLARYAVDFLAADG